MSPRIFFYFDQIIGNNLYIIYTSVMCVIYIHQEAEKVRPLRQVIFSYHFSLKNSSGDELVKGYPATPRSGVNKYFGVKGLISKKTERVHLQPG